ncbi:SDR family NAD(P)-dependent oxidoreductase (plasmid) [Mycolicibacterium psychrotolerans]|uniref:SDR family NAD(P)-dependent oxidoreductase n=1 Tax=Mycolicibacterium psychrotolerans TaxID=216929 RepID=UPI003D6713BE
MTDLSEGDVRVNAGRTAIVTGAGSAEGIGMACARALGLQGATVIITATTDRIFTRADELRHLGIRVHPVVTDLLDPDGPAAVSGVALESTGRIDVLVNNAGMTAVGSPQRPTPLHCTTAETWSSTLARNLDISFSMTKAVLPQMLAQSYGRIVMIASLSGPVMAYPGDAAYHAAKAGVTGLARSIAVDYASSGITCNSLAPGWIHTGSSTPDEVRAGAVTPIGRCGRPDEIAYLAACLAAPAASYITGQTVVVDGGNSIREDQL